MKINKNFALHNVANTWVVLPLAEKTVDFNGMLKLNESGVLLWKKLEQGAERESLADLLVNEYEVTRDQALADVDEFIEILIKAGCIE